jgi:hypothetical protein
MATSSTPSPNARVRKQIGRNQLGAASAEYAAVTAAGCGFAGVLIKLFTSDFGQNLLKMLVEFFLKMVGIG